MPRIYTKLPLEDRFWEKVEVKDLDDCWEWLATKTKGGYGKIKYEGKMECAHRISWIIHNEVIPVGMHVLHHCDNPGCVNPNHLFLGTAKDNIQDASKKGRIPKGEKHYNSKLTVKQVKEIRASKLSHSELAKIHGVIRQNIGDVINRRTWKHI